MICVFCVSLLEDNKLIERGFFRKRKADSKLIQQASLWMPADLRGDLVLALKGFVYRQLKTT